MPEVYVIRVRPTPFRCCAGLLATLLLLTAVPLSAQTPAGRPPSPGAAAARRPTPVPGLPGSDRVVDEAIRAGQMPGAVVMAGRRGQVLHARAYGDRARVPSREPMTLDTVFDLASLTKVVATTSAVMQLVEQGRIRLNDPVSTHVRGFERFGKGPITVGHLLAHTSGLRPDVDLADPWTGYDAAIELARNEVPTSTPGERFVYSDINFFLLGEIVRVVSGETLDVYVRRHVFQPLGMAVLEFVVEQPAVKRDQWAGGLGVAGVGMHQNLPSGGTLEMVLLLAGALADGDGLRCLNVYLGIQWSENFLLVLKKVLAPPIPDSMVYSQVLS